jgi:hypothetical protein
MNTGTNEKRRRPALAERRRWVSISTGRAP